MLYYIPLEAYDSRYTLQLTDWNVRVFNQHNIPFSIVNGKKLTDDNTINIGDVLDAHGRSYYALSQIMKILEIHQQGNITNDDVIYFEDMFHPGIEALPYLFSQLPKEKIPQVWVRCLAQSIDPDDFVNRRGMFPWMSKYEQMVNTFVTGILASNEEMVANMKIAGWTAPIYNISGLAFGKKEVQSRVNNKIAAWKDRPKAVAFTSRWDSEKQPHFYLEVMDKVKAIDPSIEFYLLTGTPELKSDDSDFIDLAREYEKYKGLKILTGLSKNRYYEILANEVRTVFNCALQDWTSNTVSEADALGCNVVYPGYRSFPEIFNNDYTRLYIPWSTEDAAQKIIASMTAASPKQGEISDWTNDTIARILNIIYNKDISNDRSDLHYRQNIFKNYLKG